MRRAISQKSFVHAPAKPRKQHDPDAEETTDAERAVYGTAGRYPVARTCFARLFIANIKDPTGAGEAVFRVLVFTRTTTSTDSRAPITGIASTRSTFSPRASGSWPTRKERKRTGGNANSRGWEDHERGPGQRRTS